MLLFFVVVFFSNLPAAKSSQESRKKSGCRRLFYFNNIVCLLFVLYINYHYYCPYLLLLFDAFWVYQQRARRQAARGPRAAAAIPCRPRHWHECQKVSCMSDGDTHGRRWAKCSAIYIQFNASHTNAHRCGCSWLKLPLNHPSAA